MNHYACLVCDELVRERESKAFVPDTDLALWRTIRLRPIYAITAPLCEECDVSKTLPMLKSALLSPRRVLSSSDVENERDATRVRFRDKCFRSIQLGSHGDPLNPPKLSIANGFAIGSLLVCLKYATITDHLLTSLASFSPPCFIARGGRHRAVRDHMFF